jgi:hypothetical protein
MEGKSSSRNQKTEQKTEQQKAKEAMEGKERIVAEREIALRYKEQKKKEREDNNQKAYDIRTMLGKSRR